MDQAIKQDNDPTFQRVKSSYYYGRPSPFLSNLMFFLNPAPDNLIASNIMSIIEIGIGMSFIKLGRRITVNPARKWKSRFTKGGVYLLSGHLLFCGSAQFLSNKLNEDDTILAADAKRQRTRLIINNDPVNWWFGPKYYEYMSKEELQFLYNRAKLFTSIELKLLGNLFSTKNQLLQLKANEYFYHTLLPSLKGKKFETDDNSKLELNDLNLNDENFNDIWFNILNPWDELWREVNLTINFMPQWNFINDIEND